MVKVTIAAGHGSWKDLAKKIYSTDGKRTPDGIPEWEFNNKVVKACINYLSQYQNISILRLDDPTGKTDVPLKERSNRCNSWGADIHIDVHHNAEDYFWDNVGFGIETYIYTNPSLDSQKLATLVHPKYVKAMGLKDRGIKRQNLHMLREVKCPSILTEGGFMDSKVDRLAMDDDRKLKAQGEAIAQGVVEFFGLKKKESVKMEIIKLTDGQQNAKDKLVEHGMMAEDFDFTNDATGQAVLTMTTMMAPLLTKLEKKGSL